MKTGHGCGHSVPIVPCHLVSSEVLLPHSMPQRLGDELQGFRAPHRIICDSSKRLFQQISAFTMSSWITFTNNLRPDTIPPARVFFYSLYHLDDFLSGCSFRFNFSCSTLAEVWNNPSRQIGPLTTSDAVKQVITDNYRESGIAFFA